MKGVAEKRGMDLKSMSEYNVSCRLVHHGAAASSSSHCLVWLPPSSSSSSSSSSKRPQSQIVYSSHGILNVCCRHNGIKFGKNSTESIWSVCHTLRTSMPCTTNPEQRVITCVTAIHNGNTLLCGFSNGSITAWHFHGDDDDTEWREEHVVVCGDQPAVTHLDGYYYYDDDEENKTWMIVTCSSIGTHLWQGSTSNDKTASISTTRMASYASNVVLVERMSFGNGQLLVFVGTAAPRHNKIHVYLFDPRKNGTETTHHVGSLTGHEDWITCLAWNSSQALLASGSQDLKIRLWKFTTSSGEPSDAPVVSDDDNDDGADGDDLLDDNDAEEEEGEARLEIRHDDGITRVTLEALLFGHEEAVTSVEWHPNPMPLYRQEAILISSSMDRTLLLWSPFVTGVWTPLTRVGSAGGILGGSIGSSLLGFVHAAVEPITGESLVGHAYGGALHVWSVEHENDAEEDDNTLSLEELALRNNWKATPCITGHFDGVVDLCWEAERGDYILTASADQTCRLWAPVRAPKDKDEVWVELARPQVHGYDLAAVTSVSRKEHPHLLVTGADEKEIRVYDAPMSTIRLLEAASGDESIKTADVSRVERAYIPSLGLSQKASVADQAEMDTSDVDATQDEPQLRFPLERDLGALSLWPEVRKLFGHNTELFCLVSTVSARSGPKYVSSPSAKAVLVASAAKARDVDDAEIRLWDVENGKFVQVLTGGHRSTIAALCFSPDGLYLASSGKDRRLCLWKRDIAVEARSGPSFSLASAIDSAHKRIVWGLHFSPFDPTVLASGSRDGSVKIWKVSDSIASTTNQTAAKIDETASFEPSSRSGVKAEPVTALAFAPKALKNKSAAIAIGLECGLIELWVRKLGWRPLHDDSQKDASREFTLASCGMDRGCRVFKVELSL